MSLRRWRLHGNRHGKTEAQREHFIAHDLRKRCIKKNFWMNSQSIPERLTNSWLATQNWSNWRNTHPDGRGGRRKIYFTYPHVVRRVFEIQKDLVCLPQHIWTKCAGETPIRLQRSINKDAPSSPWVWRRATLHRFLSGSIRNGIRRLLHAAHHGGSGTIPGGAHKIHQGQALLSSWNERRHRTGRPIERLLH